MCLIVFFTLTLTLAYASTSDNIANLYITEKCGKLFPNFGSPYNIEQSDGYVNPATGEFCTNTEDYRIKGKNGFDVSIVRSFNTSTTEGDIATVFYSSDVDLSTHFSRKYICSFDNEIISVTFKNEAELYEADISFEGDLYSDYSEYEYSRLSHKGTGIYYTAVNPQEKAQVKEERADYKIFPMQTKGHYSFIEDVSGMRISMPSLISYDTRGSDYTEEDCLMFQDLRGESYALSIVYDRTSNPMVFYRSALPSGVSYSKYKAKFVNEDDMMQTNIHPKGFEYNMTLESDSGDIYYISRSKNYAYDVIYAEDRYGNGYSIDCHRLDNYWRLTIDDGTVYEIGITGIKKISPDGTATEIVSYDCETINSDNDVYDKYDIDDEYIFTVTKNSGTTLSIQEDEDNKTRYFIKRKMKYEKMLRNGALSAYKLPYKIEFPSGMTRAIEYTRLIWYVSDVYSEGEHRGNNYLVSRCYEYDASDTPVNETTYTYESTNTPKYVGVYLSRTYLTKVKKLYLSSGEKYLEDTSNLDERSRITKKYVYKDGRHHDDYTYSYENDHSDSKIRTQKIDLWITHYTSDTIFKRHLYDNNEYLTEETFGDYTANYTYHTDGNYIPATIIYNKDVNTTVKTENILTEDKKSIATTNVYENDVLIKSTSYTYDSYGNITSEKVKSDGDIFYTTTYTHTYTPDGGYTVTATQGNTTTVSVYDCNRNLISYTDGNGNITAMTYDNAGRLLTKSHPDGTTESYTYDISSGITTYTAPNGTVYKAYFDAWENPVRTTVLSDGEEVPLEEYQYDDRCNVSSYKKYNTAINYTEARYTYDYLGRPEQEKIYDNGDELVKETLYTYTRASTEDDEPLFTITASVSGDNGTYAQISQTENYRGFVVEDKVFTDSDNRTTSYTHDYVGNVITATDALGNVTATEYNGLNSPTKVTNPDGTSVSTKYNLAGLVSSVTDARGNTSYSYYDSVGRLTKTTSPVDTNTNATTTLAYDGNDNVTSQKVLSSMGGEYEEYIRTDTAYDSMNRPITITTHPTDDTQSVTKYSYDNMGNVTSVTNGLPNENSPLTLGQTTTYEYDALGRMTKETTPEGKVQTYAYDLGGRLLSSTDKKNLQTQYTYDALDNILSVVKGNQSISYTYDLTGNRTAMTDSTGTTAYTYSPYGELTSERKGDILNSYTYDALGRRLSMSITDNGAPITSQTYNYDSMSRLVNTQNGTDTVEYTYDANSNVLTEKVNGTLLKETTYNAGNLPEFITTYLPDITETSHRTYSANGNLRMEFRNDRDIFYYYDGANRLILENCLGDEISYEDYYTYDRLGNRTKKEHRDTYTDETQNTSYTYNNLNQLISQTYRTETLTYSYDDNGNMLGSTKDGTPIKTYTYDVFNRLDTANTNGNTTSYTYNGDNLRQTKTVNGVTTKHIYDGQNIVADVSQNTNVYVYGIDILGMRANNGNLQIYATTPRGDISKLISTDGSYNEYEYDAYGNPIADNDHSVNPFGYTGQYTDYETGLIYLRNRYYDTELGIFITEDPAKDGLNWYAYCGGNPVVFVDLWGLYYTETDSDGRVYAVIESGDTLSGISKAEVNDVSAYTKMNYVGNPDKIYPGQKVEITGIYNDKYPNPYKKLILSFGKIGPILYKTQFPVPILFPELDSNDYFQSEKFEYSLISDEAVQKVKKYEEYIDEISYSIALSSKLDIKQVNQVCQKMGINGAARKEFGKFLEACKSEIGKSGNINFTWKELIELAKEFLE